MEVTNRFKGLDLIEYLKNFGWRFVTLYRKQGSRSFPRKRNAKKQNGYQRRQLEKKRNEKQRRKGKIFPFECRVPKNSKERLKKTFHSDQCKEIEENKRMGKPRDLFKKIRDIKGTFHANMGTIKDRNGMDLTEAEDIKKRWQEYTEELYKKIFVTHISTVV